GGGPGAGNAPGVRERRPVLAPDEDQWRGPRGGGREGQRTAGDKGPVPGLLGDRRRNEDGQVYRNGGGRTAAVGDDGVDRAGGLGVERKDRVRRRSCARDGCAVAAPLVRKRGRAGRGNEEVGVAADA